MDEDLTYRRLSLWHDTVPGGMSPRAPLPGDTEADVVVVGAGLTGLWTAYYLLARDPSLRVVLLEQRIAGFGASGRNGGWCSALFPWSAAALARRHGREAALEMRRAMVATVDEVGAVASAEGIACDFSKGGTISLVRGRAQRVRAEQEVAEAALFGVDGMRWVGEYPRARGATAAVLDPACASLHPAKLVRGLADVVERGGAIIHEQTRVLGWDRHLVRTEHGQVRAGAVVVAAEAYRSQLPGQRRAVLPLYSLMIATEPLPDRVWEEIGLRHGQTFTDYRHLLVYGQRTADNRFAFGGRGAGYHWASAIRGEYDTVPRVFRHLRNTLVDLFPQVGRCRVTHAWGGPIGVPRDWHASVWFDPGTGVGGAGGYVGDGLSATNLAGRTLADLLTGTVSSLTSLPWVNHRSPRWEPEPVRFALVNLGVAAMGIADAEERVTGRPSLAARVVAPFTGH